jgi:Major Facilitator Superfamily
MVQATVLSYLPLYTIQALGFDTIGAGLLVACSQAGGAVSRLALGAASDRWLADRRSVWLAVTGAIGAASFVSYAVWQVSAPLAAAALAFATGIGAYGWVGIFFRDQRRARRVANGRTAERHGVRVDRGRAARGSGHVRAAARPLGFLRGSPGRPSPCFRRSPRARRW